MLLGMTNPELLDQLAAAVSIETRVVVANVVEYEIEREYGVSDDAMAKGARMLAVAGIKMDIHNLFVKVNGTDRGLDGYADMQLRAMVREGLDARVCQCPESGIEFGGSGHGHRGQCERHFEADVPPVQGNKLCGDCYCATPEV